LHDGSPIRVAVVGVGTFGANHARVYRELQQQGEEVKLVAVVDTDASRADATARQFGCIALNHLQELHGRVDAASVAVPTVHHLSVSAALLAAGIDVLIEKPLTSTLDEADELITLAASNKRIAQAGHVERFNPAVRATLPLLTRPMFFEVHRLSIFTPRSLDVDVVLDLMIHDIDVVLAFAKSKIREIRAVGLPVVTGKVDIANVRLEFASGCVANLTASRVSTERVRKLRFFQPREYISIDYTRQDVLQIRVADSGSFSPEQLYRMASSTQAAPIPGVTINKPPVQSEEPLHAELRSFLGAVRHRSRPEVPLEDGRLALATALEILAAIHRHLQENNLNILQDSSR